jgi:chromosome segregation protein SMC
MYLKRIEIHGFKSFANKIVLDFHEGITGIVGPNGSGKSNVADAVRWVLGEQSAKQLRGGNMQDVIFAGTQIRKPQGFAYVAITLDNSDHSLDISYEEITVSRRIYRSGESEYMINGSACRLKDISELFFDTGIGKDGYSIIGQGQVEKILSGKAEDRRELFDEAAGITKYKRRKLLAEKKLENERENLIRVKDILSELSRQVGPLEEQSKTARKYLDLREELKYHDINIFVNETDKLRQESVKTSEQEVIALEDLERLNKDLEALNKRYEELDGAVQKLDEDIDSVKSHINDTNLEISDYEGKVALYTEQINYNQQNERNIELRLHDMSLDIEKKNNEIIKYRDDIESLNKKLEQQNALIEKFEDEIISKNTFISDIEKDISNNKSEILKSLNEKSSLLTRNQKYETLIEQIRIRKSEAAQKIIDIKTSESKIRSEFDSERQKLSKLREEEKRNKEKLDEILKQIREKSLEINEKNNNLSRLQKENQHYSAKLESLKNIAEKYEGYGTSVKRIMENNSFSQKGVHGVVAEIIKTEKKYEIAIETALGGRIQNIVTDTEETAKDLIEYLKKNKFGRATFVPLSAVRESKDLKDIPILKEDGVLGTASKLVSADAMYSSLVSNLLGRIIVVSDIDKAVIIAKKYRYEYRLVTLEGDLFNTGGSISGGAYKNASNLLGRKRELEELESSIEKIHREEEILSLELESQNNIYEKLKKSRNELNNILHEMQVEVSALSVSVDAYEKKLKDNNASGLEFIEERAKLEEEEKILSNEKLGLIKELENIQNIHKKIEIDVSEAESGIQGYRHERDDILRKLSDTRLSISGISHSISFNNENIDRLKLEIQKLEEDKVVLFKEKEENKDLLLQRKDDISSSKIKIDELRVQVAALKEDELKYSDLKSEQLKKQKEAFSQKDELSRSISGLEKETYRLSTQKEKIEERLAQLSNYMWQEYELTLSTAKELFEKVDSSGLPLSDVQKIIIDIKKQIKELGDINVHSIEEYREVSDRYELMKTQYEDIISAEASLVEIIENLDELMRKQFAEKFVEINEQFNKVFVELFGGGAGILKLEEDVDLLEAGISIISQPPGKKLQNMMQLSGGEKALTAISLLFAIQNLKPSPFALLDEIEAALDDSNVDRFANYLHKLSNRTQFIVITHRRGTMVSADRLYGITMQEKGISTLVSVNLVEEELSDK